MRSEMISCIIGMLPRNEMGDVLRMKRKMFLALLTAAVLLLSGCTLKSIDPVADAAQIILNVNGETVTKAQMANAVSTYTQQYLYSDYNAYYNYLVNGTMPSQSAMLSATVESLTRSMVLKQEVDKQGLVEKLTEEEIAELQTEIDEEYEEQIEYIQTSVLKDSENTGDALREEAIAYADGIGYTKEALLDEHKNSKAVEKLREGVVAGIEATDEEIQAKLDEYIAQQQETYEGDPAAFGSDANNGTALYWAPEGYRYVKQILVKFTDEDQTAIDAAQSALNTAKKALSDLEAAAAEAADTASEAVEDAADKAADTVEEVKEAAEEAKEAVEGAAEEAKEAVGEAVEEAKEAVGEAIEEAKEAVEGAAEEAKEAAEEAVEELTPEAAQAAVDEAQKAYDEAVSKALENIKGRAQEAYEKAAAEGADFDALVEEYNDDPGMTREPMKTNGYAVSAAMTSFDPAFLDAAMGLEKIGDVAEPAAGMYGYYIIKYESDVASGAKTFEEVKESLGAEVTAAKQNEAYEAQVAAWIEAADIKSWTEKMGY